MNNHEKTSSGGIGFTGALQIVFIVLKLLGKIKWPWIWVLSPMWITIGITILLIIIYIWMDKGGKR